MRSEYISTVTNGHTMTISQRYDLEKSEQLGCGAFFTTVSAIDTVKQTEVAIKRVRPYTYDQSEITRVYRELMMLKYLKAHPNFLKLYDLSVLEEKQELYFIMEMMECDLLRVICSKQVLTERHHQCFLKQILEGINYMHKSRIVHCYLRPSSFLVDRYYRLRISELDQARYIGYEGQFLSDEEELGRIYGRCLYHTAPELLLSFRFLNDVKSIDMFSIGAIFGEMLKRAPLFPGKDRTNQLKVYLRFVGYEDGQELGFNVVEEARAYLSKRCVARKVNLTKELPNASLLALHLLDCLIQTNPTKRPAAEVALLHPFLDDVETIEDYSNVPSPRDLIDPDQLFDFQAKGKYSLKEMKSKISEECEYYRLENQL